MINLTTPLYCELFTADRMVCGAQPGAHSLTDFKKKSRSSRGRPAAHHTPLESSFHVASSQRVQLYIVIDRFDTEIF